MLHSAVWHIRKHWQFEWFVAFYILQYPWSLCLQITLPGQVLKINNIYLLLESSLMTASFQGKCSSASVTNFGPITYSCSSIYVGWLVGGERCKGDGTRCGSACKACRLRTTLHPGKGSLRSSGPICSRRGKWHIIGSRPDKGFVYITLPDTRLT